MQMSYTLLRGPTTQVRLMVGETVQNSQSLYSFTFTAVIVIHEYIYSHSTTKFTFKKYICLHLTTYFLFTNIFAHIYGMYSFTYNGLYPFTFTIQIFIQHGAIHSRPQRPRFFRSAPRITTSGKPLVTSGWFRTRKSANHGLPARLRNLRNLKQLVAVNGYQNRPPLRLRVFRNRPEVVILCADRKNRGLWGQEWVQYSFNIFCALPLRIIRSQLPLFSELKWQTKEGPV